MKSDTPFYYSTPFLLALCLHVLILTFLIIELNHSVKSTPGGSASASQPIIHATAVSQQTVNNYENQIKAQQEAVIKQQQLQQQIAREKIIQQQHQEILKQQQIKRLEMQKLQAIQAAKQKAIEAQQKAIAEKEAAQKAAEQKAIKKAEEKAEKRALQKALQKDMQKQLASDQSELNQNEKNSEKPSAQHSTATSNATSSAPLSQGEIDKYKALIIQAISSQWIVPPNLPQNISCELDVRVAPGGVVLQATITRSSGNPVLDNSAIAAVNKASPLPVPTTPGLFDQFRELHLTVKPDGSMTEVTSA